MSKKQKNVYDTVRNWIINTVYETYKNRHYKHNKENKLTIDEIIIISDNIMYNMQELANDEIKYYLENRN